MQAPTPTVEHKWLDQMLGTWQAEYECSMGPDQPPGKFAAVEVVRSIGGLWIQAEAESENPGGGKSQNIITLGYDPQQKRFVGTFISSMMTHLWIYKGSLDAAGKVLTLDAEGPSFDGQGMAQYQDIFTAIDENHRTLSSQVLGKDGQWTHFMSGKFTRQK